MSDSTKKNHFPPYPENIASLIPSQSVVLNDGVDTVIGIATNSFQDGMPWIGFYPSGSEKIERQPIGYSLIINEDTLLLADLQETGYFNFPGNDANGAVCITSLNTKVNAVTLQDTLWDVPLNEDSLTGWEYQKGFFFDTLQTYYTPVSFVINLLPYNTRLEEFSGMGGEYYEVTKFDKPNRTVWYIATDKQMIKLQLVNDSLTSQSVDTLYFRLQSFPLNSSITNQFAPESFTHTPYLHQNRLILPQEIKADRLVIYSLSGREVFRKNGDNLNGMNLGKLPQGFYVYQLLSQNIVTYKNKILIQ